MSTSPDPARTVFLLCPSWHGATLLGMLLGNHSRAFSLGDTLHSAWPFPCRCGQPSDVCEFWTAVRADSAVSGDAPLPRRPQLLTSPALDQAAVSLLAAVANRTRFVPQAFAATLATNRALQRTARAHKPFALFIDGCKSPTRYAALRADRGLASAGIIHLLRDPRAFTAAAKRRGMTVAAACRSWVRYHRAVDPIARLFRDRVYTLRYEDFCGAPERELERLQQWLGLTPESLLRPIEPRRHWTGSGSITGFDGEIRLSERWRDELSATELDAIAVATRRTAERWDYDLLAA